MVTQVGEPLVLTFCDGHRGQADALLSRANVVVFVIDRTRQALEGGSLDTLKRAGDMKREVILIEPRP